MEKILSKILLDKKDRVDRYDANYIDDFHHIVREQYSVQSVKEFDQHEDLLVLKQEMSLSNDMELREVTNLLREKDLNVDLFSPKHLPGDKKKIFKYDITPGWEDSKGIKLSEDEESVSLINEIQKNYSFSTSGHKNVFWGRPEAGGDVWTSVFMGFAQRGVLTEESHVLTIGPRHNLEIKFFRNTLGLKNTIGLDLFTEDEEYVKVGDMHDMPFEDNTFDMVYQKNTFNKSYDIRTVLDECIRVLRPGGVLVSDECLGYTLGVSELSRTNITSNEWYTKYLRENIDEVVYNKEYLSRMDWLERVGFFAALIKK